MDWIRGVQRLREQREAGVLVTVTEVTGHAPREAGAKMVVSETQTWGSIGGGNLEAVAVDRARAEGVDVVGFIYWSLIDNFEWSHGRRGHFGLFSIDFDDPVLTRRPTSAVATFQEAARSLGTLQ
jgi:hypothetical protein